MRKLVMMIAVGVGLAVGFSTGRASAAPPATEESQSCCKHCRNSQPCGNSCISWDKTCHQPPGCAC